MKVLIKDKTVFAINIIEQDGKFYSPATNTYFNDGVIVETNEIVSIGYTYENGVFKAPVVVQVVEVPTQITPRQIRQQLTAIGLRQTVEDLISTSTDYDLKDWWNHSQDFQRLHPILKEMGEKLGMSEEDMDNFFIEASKL